jgi:hypothetical protein
MRPYWNIAFVRYRIVSQPEGTRHVDPPHPNAPFFLVLRTKRQGASVPGVIGITTFPIALRIILSWLLAGYESNHLDRVKV